MAPAVSGKDALGWDLAEALAPLGEKARAFHDLPALVQAIAQSAQAGDQVVGHEQWRFWWRASKILDALAK